MSTVVAFRLAEGVRRVPRSSDKKGAEIVLFPGVRYEYHAALPTRTQSPGNEPERSK
jgi:hypothetical protein